jgi:hypothetical protein
VPTIPPRLGGVQWKWHCVEGERWVILTKARRRAPSARKIRPRVPSRTDLLGVEPWPLQMRVQGSAKGLARTRRVRNGRPDQPTSRYGSLRFGLPSVRPGFREALRQENGTRCSSSPEEWRNSWARIPLSERAAGSGRGYRVTVSAGGRGTATRRRARTRVAASVASIARDLRPYRSESITEHSAGTCQPCSGELGRFCRVQALQGAGPTKHVYRK